MILQSLCKYYQRLSADPDSEIPPYGFSVCQVSAVVEISKDGTLVGISDIRETDGKKARPKKLKVPAPPKRTSAITPSFLCDKTDYVFGLGGDPDDKKKSKKHDNDGKERCKEAFEAFRKIHRDLAARIADDGLNALVAFLDGWNSDDAPSLPYWEDIKGQNVVFRLSGDLEYLHDRKKIKDEWVRLYEEREAEINIEQTCLVSGEKAKIASLHPSIKGVVGAQSSGANIVSFNATAFESYGNIKAQGKNAPVSIRSAFEYTTALNFLLSQSSNRKLRIGDTSVVFWTEEATPIEDLFGQMLDPRDAEEEATKSLRLFLEAVKEGKKPLNTDLDMPFYILGLSANASRLSVRFWLVSTVGDIGKNLLQHFEDMEIERYGESLSFPSIYRLLCQTAREAKEVNPLLAGAMARSIFTGCLYPQNLMIAILNRLRSCDKFNSDKASLIKAALTRKARFLNTRTEVSVSLDVTRVDTPYLLGRLFAVLEKAQEEAIPDANSTIRDRYFGTASASPKVVFPILIRNSTHHIAKLSHGVVHEKLIGEILDSINNFPVHLDLDGQGMFAIGYYHQRQFFFRPKVNKGDK